jgi:hypothetical protein
MKTLAQRFWEKVAKTEACWLWTACTNPNGYGVIGKGARIEGMLYAHRVAWELTNGPIPDGLVIDHLCRNRRCVNPTHLEVVSTQENTRRGMVASKTHCVRGHSLTDARIRKNGTRLCRKCDVIRHQIKKEGVK